MVCEMISREIVRPGKVARHYQERIRPEGGRRSKERTEDGGKNEKRRTRQGGIAPLVMYITESRAIVYALVEIYEREFANANYFNCRCLTFHHLRSRSLVEAVYRPMEGASATILQK
jgi:hypothetical protein